MAPKGYSYKLTGLQNVLQNLNEKIDDIKNMSEQGVYKAALIIERESKKRTPVDTGNLKAGTYTRPLKTSRGPGAEIGYTSNYAIHVHEKTENRHIVGEAKFLEKALKAKEKQVLAAIRGELIV
ncbi:MAG: hypothetical protein ACQEQF_00400 [Bacillota bacterium]